MDRFLVPIQQGSSQTQDDHVFQPKMSSEDKALHDMNRLVFGNPSFRPQQLDIIKAVLHNEDLFVIMPTGGGKSLCYALPAVMSKGVTVVVSPLISLIEDQVSGFIQMPSGGIPSAYLTSTCTETMAKAVFEDLLRCRAGIEPFIKLLYVTPERIVKALKTRDVLQELYQNEMLARFVIDEAHCVSAWGHDFRKDYASLKVLKDEYPEAPIVALTATARKKVADDTLRILNISQCHRFHTGFDRPNLYFEVVEKPAKLSDTYQQVLNYIQTYFPNATGIVYCMTKAECEETADFLRSNNIAADYYHAGQTKAERKLVQAAWLQGQIKVVCATIAYGMGIDMPSVRYVIHLSLAKAIEGYYQEAGRAGRDGNYSECIIFFNNRDVDRLARIMSKPKLSKKDKDMLEEMEYYCVDRNSCRRQIFCEKFTESRGAFVRCKTKCDNCKAANGERRRNFDPSSPTASTAGPLRLESKGTAGPPSRSSSFVSATSVLAGQQKSSVPSSSSVLVKRPSSFVKATGQAPQQENVDATSSSSSSRVRPLASLTRSLPKTVVPIASSLPDRSTTSKPLQPKAGSASDEVINLLEDDDDWLEPLVNKRAKK